MQQITDHLDLSYCAASEHSVGQFNQAIEAYLGSRVDTMALLDNLRNSDPDMPMGVCFRGYMLKLAGDPKFIKPLTQILEHLKTLPMNDREKQHCQALSLWAEDQMTEALSVLEELILAYPKDILALRIAHYLHFYAGTPTSMAASIEQVFPLWQPDEPYFGYLSGMRAFALEEAGNYTEALEMGYQAIDYHASDIWAAHAVAHVMQMQDRFEEGMQWIARMSPLWDDTNNFRYHLYWHNALFYLGLDRLNDVLTIYDTQLTDCLKDDFYLDMCNAAALLWRLECKGVNTDERWASLLPLCEKRLTDQELVFSNLHYLMAPAALGQVQLIDQGIDNLQRWSVKNNTQAQRCQLAGLDLAISLRHLAQKEYASAAEKLEKAAPHLYSIGGSHAQRQLFGQLQVYCEERAGNT